MSRLSDVFTRCKSENRAALIGYLTAGDPDVETSKTRHSSCQRTCFGIGNPYIGCLQACSKRTRSQP